MEKFAVLVQEMSPENLTCDGELSQSRVYQKMRKLNKQWLRLEKDLGRNVTGFVSRKLRYFSMEMN
jgi:hypothetical protein